MYCTPGNHINQAFFAVLKTYILSYLDKFSRFQLIKLLDIYKYNSNFGSPKMKQLMEA